MDNFLIYFYNIFSGSGDAGAVGTAVDLGTYITALSAELTAVGIILGLYYFMVGLINKEDSPKYVYLDKNIIGYVMDGRGQIISRKFSVWIISILLVLTLALIPIRNWILSPSAGGIRSWAKKIIFETEDYCHVAEFSAERIAQRIDSYWYIFVVILFAVTIVALLQGISSIAQVNKIGSGDKVFLNKILNKMDKDFMRRRREYRRKNLKFSSAERLAHEVESVVSVLKKNRNQYYEGRYIKLLELLFDEYLGKRKIQKKKFKIRCYFGKVDTKEKEVIEALQGANRGIWEDRDILIDIFERMIDDDKSTEDKLIKFVMNKHLQVILADIRTHESYLESRQSKQSVAINDLGDAAILKRINNPEYMNKEERTSKWLNLTIRIYDLASPEERSYLLELLDSSNERVSKEYADYCSQVIKEIMSNSMDSDDVGVENIALLEKISKKESYNNWMANIINVKLASNRELSDGEIGKIKLAISFLNLENKLYVFSYQILYYSRLVASFTWRHINLEIMNLLWEGFGYSEISYNQGLREKVCKNMVERISRSTINHRTSSHMVINLIDYIFAETSEQLLNRINEEAYIDIVYFIIIKVCTVDYRDKLLNPRGLDTAIHQKLIMFLSKYVYLEELTNCERMNRFMKNLAYQFPAKFISEEEMRIYNLRALILTQAMIDPELLNEKSPYRYNKDLGKYMLVYNYSNLLGREDLVNELIWQSYIESNQSMTEYVEYLADESAICGYHMTHHSVTIIRQRLDKIIRDNYQAQLQ